MTKKDIAIIGGTFNPVHNAHIEMAEYLSKNYIVDEVWMLPSYNSPHKNIDTKKSYNNRYNMIKLAIKGLKNVYISNFEKEYYDNIIKNDNTDVKTYTIDILKAIEKKYLNIRIHFIVGFDSMKQITTWHNYKDLLNKYWFYIFDRDDEELKTIYDKRKYIDNIIKNDDLKFYYEFMDYKISNISSSKIRMLFKNLNNENESFIKNMICEDVYNYIIKNKLYV